MQWKLVHATALIVEAYVAAHKLPASELPSVIASTYAALARLGQPAVAPPPSKASSAEIRRSIRPDALVSFLDGRSYKTLRRHLSSRGLTAEEYRTRFGLPSDYPMIASTYAQARSDLAKSLGLGKDSRGRPRKR